MGKGAQQIPRMAQVGAPLVVAEKATLVAAVIPKEKLPSKKEIRDSIPEHCFQHSYVAAFAHVLRDGLVIGAFAFLAATTGHSDRRCPRSPHPEHSMFASFARAPAIAPPAGTASYAAAACGEGYGQKGSLYPAGGGGAVSIPELSAAAFLSASEWRERAPLMLRHCRCASCRTPDLM